MKLETYPDREALYMALANRLAGALRSALAQRGHATFCAPGGTTPGPVYDLLSGVDLDWANVKILLNDERWVPETSPRSNTAQLRARLLTGRAAAARYLPLYAPAEAPEDAIEALGAAIAPHLPIDLLLLGMGEDMHTASLFPGGDRTHEALAESAPVLLPIRAEAAGEPRVTLTAPVLRDAMDIHVLILGDAKRAALERAQHLTPQEAPIAAVLPHATIHWAE